MYTLALTEADVFIQNQFSIFSAAQGQVTQPLYSKYAGFFPMTAIAIAQSAMLKITI